MGRIRNLSFLSRLWLCIIVSFVLNSIIGQYLKSCLSKGSYTVTVDAFYVADATMELMYDTGVDFNQKQRVPKTCKKGKNILQFPFELNEGEQLKYLRLDFGTIADLNQVEINSISLSSDGRTMFQLENKQIPKKLGLLTGILKVDELAATFFLDTDRKPFDPYIVFDSVNELIFLKWQRILALVLPWLVLFFFPLLNWMKRLRGESEYKLFFIGLFCAAIPLKIAWVTFSTLLLLAYSFYSYYKERKIRLDPILICLFLLFCVPLFFIGEGDISKLAIPFGFVFFTLIGSLVDFSDRTKELKKIYITVFFILMSIAIVSWLLLMCYNGYYYNIGWTNYFTNIKSHAHATMYWLYYPHTTFLSFFIIIGGLFCLDLYEKGQLFKVYVFTYALFALCTLVLLGSRFALLLGVALPFLYRIPVKYLSRWLLPIWATIFAGIVYFIGFLDVHREQLWQVTWTSFKEKIWLGHGTGTSNIVLPNHLLIDKGGVETIMKVNHSHNQFLTYLLENGMLGALFFLVIFIFLFHQFAKKANKTMLLVSFMILLLMIIESPFRTTTSLYVIAFLISIFHTSTKKSLSE